MCTQKWDEKKKLSLELYCEINGLTLNSWENAEKRTPKFMTDFSDIKKEKLLIFVCARFFAITQLKNKRMSAQTKEKCSYCFCLF